MAILLGDQIAPNKIRVVSITYTSDTPINENWHYVPTKDVPLPQDYPNPGPGKQAQLVYDTQTKDFSFEIVDVPLSPEEEKDVQIVKLNQLLEDAISLLIENGVL